jgi:1-acyl-sn-glycerol-3-phosphate acyltransferase
MLRIVGVAIAFTTITLALIPLQWVAIRWRLPLRRAIPVAYHRVMCRLLGVRIRETGTRSRQTPLLIASNHVSWLDIPVLTALGPMVFVAKSEVGTWPVVGLLARLQRSVFVDRGRRHKVAEVNRAIAERLAEGDPVVLFAEGTSSDGNRVLPFRSSLIGAVQAARNAEDDGGVNIQPLAIVYTGIDGLPAGRQHRPHLAWYGAMELFPHLKGIVRRGAVDVAVIWGEPFVCDAGADRKAVARLLEGEVRRLAASARNFPRA